MLKRIGIATLFFAFSLPLFSQVSVNPQNEFYSDAVSWRLKGYVESLPQIKPYPAAMIRNILEQVAECGDEFEEQKAKTYLERYFDKSWHAGIAGGADARVKKFEGESKSGENHYSAGALGYGKIFASGDNVFLDFVSLGYDAGFITANNHYAQTDVLPVFETDSSRRFIKNYSARAGNADFLFDVNAAAAVGNETVYGSFGFHKLGYGLYPDGDIILNPSSYQLLNGAFHYNGERFKYSQILALPFARAYRRQNDYGALKFLSFHALEVPLFARKLSLSFYESAVWGKSFSPAYLLPAPWFVIANVAGFNENVISGVEIKWLPLSSLALTVSAAFDDLKLKQFFKLKMDDAAVRTAFKTGILYSPPHSSVSLISLDYTLVTPYTYTKYNTFDDTYNFMDYTNFGIGIGAALPPNSDKVALKLHFKPFRRMKICVDTAFLRHGNPYESFSDDEAAKIGEGFADVSTGGDITSDSRGTETALDSTNFLKQEHIMYVMQASLGLAYEFVKKGLFSAEVSGGYTFEYVKNDGVTKEIYRGRVPNAADAAAARQNWISNLHDSYNHYFNCGIKFTF
ncbi:MAG: hypothetical protein ACTTKL_02195 [Treponema sp.]